jgi:hypothetical protein
MYKEVFVQEKENKQVTLYYKDKNHVKCFTYDTVLNQKTAVNKYDIFYRMLMNKGYVRQNIILDHDSEYPEGFLNDDKKD